MNKKVKNLLKLMIITSMVVVPLFIPVIVGMSTKANASFDDLVREVMPSGTMTNTTASAIVRDQEAGHFIGGSSVIKTPANPKLQLFKLTPPSCRLGGLPCGAQFELLGGAVSVVSGQELMRYLKTLPQTAATYAAMMAIKTVCSHCHTLLEYLDGKADWLNGMSFDGCKTMQNLMDPVFAKLDAKMQGIRQSNMLLTGGRQDMASIQQASKEDRPDEVRHPDMEEQLESNYNLVWRALNKKLPADATALKELLMSLSGTIVSTKDAEGKINTKYLKSLVNRDLVHDFIGMDGRQQGQVKLYVCNDASQCLNPLVRERGVHPASYLYRRIKELLESITRKIEENSEQFTADEEALLALSWEQLILRIEIDLSSFAIKENVTSRNEPFIEAIAVDVVSNYMQSLANEVQEALHELSKAQLAGGDMFQQFSKDIDETIKILGRMRTESRAKYDMITQNKIRLKRDYDYRKREFESFFNNQDEDGDDPETNTEVR